MIQWKAITSVDQGSISAKSLHSGVFYNNEIYIFGGTMETENCFTKFNLEKKTWINLKTEMTPKLGHSCVVYKDILVFYGGWDRPNLSNELYYFDPNSNLTTEVFHKVSTNFPTKMCYHSCNIYNSSMIIFGGCFFAQNHNFTRGNKILQFSFETTTMNMLTAKGDIPKERSGNVSLIYNDCLFIHGGYGINSERYNDVFMFDLINQTWKEIKTTGYIPMKKSGSSCVYFDKKMILFGGGDDYSTSDELYEFDLITHKITIIGSISFEPSRRKFASLMIDKDNVYLFGGEDSSHFNDLSTFQLPSRIQKVIFESIQQFNDVDFIFYK
jgi:N-acetylneuraminic acid mutarotase